MREVWVDEDERARFRHCEMLAALYTHWYPDGVGWTVNDLMGKSDRGARKLQLQKDKMTTQRILIAASQPGELPDWVKELEANSKKSVQ